MHDSCAVHGGAVSYNAAFEITTTNIFPAISKETIVKKDILIRGLCTLLLLSTSIVQADVKMGFGVDRGLGVTTQLDNNFNFFVGNDGVAADYLFSRGQWNEFEGTPLHWYVGGGLFADWNKGYGVRMPLGVELDFAPGWQAYAQIAPDLDLDDGAKFGIQGAIALRYSF